jgi:hypothetical protein
LVEADLLPGLATGEYTVVYWETYSGTRLGDAQLSAVGPEARLRLPGFERDLAVVVRRIDAARNGDDHD